MIKKILLLSLAFLGINSAHAENIMFSGFPYTNESELETSDFLVGYRTGSPNTNYRTTIADIAEFLDTGGNVTSDGTASNGQFSLYSPDAFNITQSPLTYTPTQIGYNDSSSLVSLFVNNTSTDISSATALILGNTADFNAGSAYVDYQSLGVSYWQAGYQSSPNAYTIFDSQNDVNRFLVAISGLVQTTNNTLDDGSGNLSTAGNVTVGSPAGPGATLLIPTNNFNSYQPTIQSGTDGTYSSITYSADSQTFNIDPALNFKVIGAGDATVFQVTGAGETTTFSGNILDDGSTGLAVFNGELQATNSVQDQPKMLINGVSLDGSSDTEGAAVVLINNTTDNRQYGYADSAQIASPSDTAGIFRVLVGSSNPEISAISTDLSTDLPLLINQNYAPLHIFGFTSLGNDLPQYKLDVQDTDAALHLGANSGIPTTPSDGVVFYSNFDEGLGHSLAYYVDDAGNVTQIGEGSGGGGTVTEVVVTSDLTVDGTPSGSFTVDGTIGLAPTAVTADTYTFGNGHVTVDANGRITDAANSTDLGTVTEVDTNNGLLGGPITTTGTIGIDPTWLYYDGTNSNAYMLSAFGANLTSGTGITAGGNIAGYNIIDSVGITAYGASAVGALQHDDYTTGIGFHSFWTAELNYGTAIGANSCLGNLTGDYATCIGYNSGVVDSSDWANTNWMAIGPNAKVGASNSYSYGDGTINHGFNVSEPGSAVHVYGGNTSGTYGQNGMLRLNGIPFDADNNWPVTELVKLQNAVITDGATSQTILVVPLSNGLGGSATQAEIFCNAIEATPAPAPLSGVTGNIIVNGMFDGASGYYVNAGTSPVPMVLNLTGPDTTLALASVAISVGSSGSNHFLQVDVTGVNATYVNWNCWAEYSIVQYQSNMSLTSEELKAITYIEIDAAIEPNVVKDESWVDQVVGWF